MSKKKRKKTKIPLQIPKQQEKNPNSRRIIRAQKMESFSGPIPPPIILDKYNQIIPGAAERILKMAELQSEHRRNLEKKVIDSDTNNSRLGLIFALIIGLSGLVASVILGIYGQIYLSGIIGISTLGSLVGTFVYGSKKRKEERGSKK